MIKSKIIGIVALFLLSNINFSQNLLYFEFSNRMNDAFDATQKSSPKFSKISVDTITLYEIEYYAYDSLGLHQKCTSLSFFSKELKFNNIKKIIKNNSFIKLGLNYESLRPNSNLNPNNRNNYELENLIIHSTDEYCYKINNKEYYKLFKSRAIISNYHCNSKEWYKYYYPLRKKRNKKFNYVEINNVLERKEITDNTFLNSKRVKFVCNQVMY